MNREKENLSIKYNTSKDSKLSHQINSNANSKRQNLIRQTEEISNEKKAALNYRKSTNIMVNSKHGKFQENKAKRNSVSPVADNKFKKVLTNNLNNIRTKQNETKSKFEQIQTACDSNCTKNSSEINSNTTNAIVPTEICNLKITENFENSSNNSKNKRKYSIFSKESPTELKTFSELQSKLEDCYKDYEVDTGKNWIQNFKENVLQNEILFEDNLLIPRTFSSLASKILNMQTFWVLWIELIKSTKEEISIQNLIDIFNESFKHINEENLIKSYFLKCIKQIDQIKMKEFLKSKGKDINENSNSFTNDIYLDLLDPFAQFLIRSKSKKGDDQKPSEERKKLKKINDYESEHISACQDVELMITSNLKREFINTQISQNENFVYSKSKIPYCKKNIFKT